MLHWAVARVTTIIILVLVLYVKQFFSRLTGFFSSLLSVPANPPEIIFGGNIFQQIWYNQSKTSIDYRFMFRLCAPVNRFTPQDRQKRSSH